MKNTMNKKNIFESMKGYENKIAISIPSTIDADQTFDNSEYIDQALSLFSNLFGGASSEDIRGAWNSNEKGLIKEDIKRVYSYFDVINDIQAAILLTFAEKLKEELKQEAIALEYNNKMIFI